MPRRVRIHGQRIFGVIFNRGHMVVHGTCKDAGSWVLPRWSGRERGGIGYLFINRNAVLNDFSCFKTSFYELT